MMVFITYRGDVPMSPNTMPMGTRRPIAVMRRTVGEVECDEVPVVISKETYRAFKLLNELRHHDV